MRNEHVRGFTLVELMIAMVCTMIISGAIYGLLSGGQSAFRREPELTDRQQNIRLAMDIIMRDINAAGTNMNPPNATRPAFLQVFTTNLDGSHFTSCSECPMGASGNRTDELEMISNPLGLEAEAVCSVNGGGDSTEMWLVAGTTNVKANSVVMLLLSDGTWTLRNLTDVQGSSSGNPTGCDKNYQHMRLQMNRGGGNDPTGLNQQICVASKQVTDPTSGACIGCTGDVGTACCSAATCTVTGLLAAEMVRYRIRNGPDNVPNLERWSSGSAANFSGTTRVYQVIARGIDDLQVTYTPAGNPTSQVNDAPVVGQTYADFASVTQTVTVTLSSRSEARNIAGAKTATSGPTALRGTLTSSGSPRAALAMLGIPLNVRDGAWAGGDVPSGQPTPWF